MDKYFKIEKREVPQLCEKTGISQDYWNQINALVSHYKMTRGGAERVKEFLINRKSPFYIERYEDVYLGYDNVINDKNRESVKRLNELALLMNNILKDPSSINENILIKACNEIRFLIYGKNDIEI